MRGDRGILADCLVDSDAEGLSRARRLRRKAFIASIALEAALIAGMLLWPLITPGVLPRHYVLTPAPPFHGAGSRGNPGKAQHADGPHRVPVIRSYNPIFPPPTSSAQHQHSSGEEFDDGRTGPPGIAAGFGPGPVISGGSDFGPTIPDMPAPAPPKPLVPRPMSEGVMEAALTYRVLPAYPLPARLARISGVVRLRAIIATDGSVRELTLLSGNPLLAQSAILAVRQWRYHPTRLNGEAVEVETLITVNFVLQ